MTTEHIDAQFRESTALAVREEPRPPAFLDVLRPKDRIAMATEIADAIKDVIVQRGWLKHIGESDHVYVEGWQFVASLAGASCKVVSSSPLPDGKGWEAHAQVVRIDTGVVIGAGSGMCSRAESKWARRDDYALRSMAETRSMSRALRGVFSFIIELAGYRATPAEEMPDHDTDPLTDRRPSGSAAHPTQGRANSEPRGTAGAAGHVRLAAPARIPIAELVDQARSLGIADFRAWLVANISADLATRGLRPAESIEAKRLLDLAQGAVMAAHDAEPERRIQPRTNGRLFAMLDERGMKDKEDRLVWAAEHGIIVTSFAELTDRQGRDLIAKLELIPPHDARDEEDALMEEYERQKAFGFPS